MSSFVFRDTKQRQALVLDFFNSKGRVEPLEFISVLKSLKGLAHEMKSDKNVGTDYAEPDRTD